MFPSDGIFEIFVRRLIMCTLAFIRFGPSIVPPTMTAAALKDDNTQRQPAIPATASENDNSGRKLASNTDLGWTSRRQPFRT